MEEKVWKLSVFFLTVLAALAVLALPYLPAIHTMDVEFREARLAQKNYEENLFQMKHMAMQNGGGVGQKTERSVFGSRRGWTVQACRSQMIM